MSVPPQQLGDRQTFLSHLRQSGLVTGDQLGPLLQRLPSNLQGRALALTLTEHGLLTRFQAECLLAGRWSGFHLGQYRLLEQVGKGGMGRVYKAEHLTMRRVVALKVLAPDLLKTKHAVELFLHEVRAVGQLVHPNIVTAYDAGAVNGRYYLVLEYVDGPNLDQLVRKQGPLSVGLACDYVRQAACGLLCAHQRGMIHRDIKPANILVQRHGLTGDGAPGLVKISDFGLARLSLPATPGNALNTAHGTIFTRDNTVMGTPDYLSPEQSRSLHKVDIRSDLYSLGCTFYFLLTGSVPFPGGSALDKLIRHATEQPAPVTSFRSDVPAPVLAVVSKLMAKDPRERFQSPAELVAALEPFAVSGPTPWAPQPVPAPLVEGESSSVDSEDLSALVNTVAGDISPTPTPTSPSRVMVRRPRQEQLPLALALVVATAIAVGLLGLAAALALLLGR